MWVSSERRQVTIWSWCFRAALGAVSIGRLEAEASAGQWRQRL
jgi:hypothetical protein